VESVLAEQSAPLGNDQIDDNREKTVWGDRRSRLNPNALPRSRTLRSPVIGKDLDQVREPKCDSPP
jgi:hypothetical protein